MEFTRRRIKDTQEIDINLKIENNSASANDYLIKGDINFQKNNLDQALLDYRKALEIEQSGKAHFMIAQIYHTKNHLQLALDCYNKAISYDNSIQDIFYFRGSVYLGLRNYENAIQDFTTAINLSPNDYNNFFYRALTYENAGQIQNAISDYSKALNISSQNYEAYYNRGRLYLSQNQQQNAIDDFNRAIQLNPEIQQKAYAILQKFDEQKKIQEQIRLKEQQVRKQKELELQRIERNKTEFNRLMQLARKQKTSGQNSTAIQSLNKALKLNNLSAEAYFIRGEILWYSGEKTKALSDFNKASDIDERYSSMMLAIVGVDAVKYAGKFIGNLFKKK